MPHTSTMASSASIIINHMPGGGVSYDCIVYLIMRIDMAVSGGTDLLNSSSMFVFFGSLENVQHTLAERQSQCCLLSLDYYHIDLIINYSQLPTPTAYELVLRPYISN